LEDTTASDGNKGDQVALMTLHSAKGLEFPVVFLVGMEEGIFPHSRSLDDEAEMEEERRLAYVGITRAEQELHLTRAKLRSIYGHTSMNPASRFLEEIPKELLELKGEPSRSQRATSSTSIQQRPIIRPTIQPITDWVVGDKAQHTKWGLGTVVQVSGTGEDLELNIAFPAPIGLKKLLAKFAPITKANE
jgi:DNA helicase-2/ATP-dependent DNA helicase PcrA